jgi:hypothetical protein
MSQLNTITFREIERLDQSQLTELLLRLLRLEASRHNLFQGGIAVSLKLSVSDGGEDGRIKWDCGPERTEYIPNRFTIFQSKATEMSPTKCKAEVCKKKSKELKHQVKEVLDADGTYVLFYGRECNPKHCQPRINEIFAAIRESGANCAAAAKIEIYDGQRIANWCNQYAAAVAYVCERTGFQLPLGLKTWGMWAKHPDHQMKFFTNPTLEAYITQLRSALAKPKAVIRVEGLSGLGKTRLVLESLRATDAEVDLRALLDSVVYFDASSLDEKDLVPFAGDLANRGIEGILVVDNCSAATHKRLAAEAGHRDSYFKLVTIDYDLTRPGHLDSPLIRLEPRQFEDVVKELLKHSYRDLKQGDLERIALFAQGFPQIAALLAKARKQGHSNIGALNDDDLLEKLLWARGEPDDGKARNVIECCAIFDALGFTGKAATERNFVAEEICKINGEEFYGICQRFVDRGICQIGGDYLQVTQKPLALRLAAEWWRKRPPESVPPLLAKLGNNRLGQALCDQMAKLDFLPQARELTKQLCGERGPFGRAEVLVSDEGSRLFRSLVEVNPQAGARALCNAFGTWAIDDLRSVAGTVRRNLVSALEKVCFWADTFPSVAAVLLSFAAAENEVWANNASGQFLQLFHILLPGTKASLAQRMQIAKDAIASRDIEKQKLGIKALGSALQTRHFSRMGGVETQGSCMPDQDYQPTNEEVREYWREAIQLLVSIGEGDGEFAVLAREQLASKIRGLLKHDLVDEAESAIKKISGKHCPWPAALSAINNSLEFEGPRLRPEVRDRLKILAESLQTVALVDRLRLLISVPEWEHKKSNDGHFVDVSQMRAEAFADELAAQGASWFHHLPIILDGEQRQGLAFGHRLATRSNDPWPFIDAALAFLRALPKGTRNFIVLAGFLRGVADRDIVTSVLDRIKDDPQLNIEIVNLTRLTKPTKEDLDRLVLVLQRGAIAVERFRGFAYNSVLDDLQAQDVIDFCQSLVDHDASGVIYGFDILYMYCLQGSERWTVCKSAFRSLLRKEGVLDAAHRDAMLALAWQDTIEKLLTSEPNDEDLAVHVAKEIVKWAANEDFSYSADDFIMSTLETLFSQYFESTWPVIGAALISDDRMTTNHLTHALGDLSDKNVGASLIAAFPIEFLHNWCDQNRPKAAHVLARITPVVVQTEASVLWHPVAKMLLDNFGEDEEMLSELSANLGTYSWTRSLIPYYEQQLALIQQLANHPLLAVRKWQAQNAEWLQYQIAFERKREEEERLGVR